MILRGRGISKGRGEGEVILSERPVSFLGGVNPSDGVFAESSEKKSIKGKVFAFPRGRGSTVGSYVLLEMKRCDTLPSAMINAAAEPIVATGAVMAGVPLVDHIDISLLRGGDKCIVNGLDGTIELNGVSETRVVTSILSYGEKVLLLKRSDDVGSFQRHWAGVSGFIEKGESPIECAIKEINEETGFSGPQLILAGQPVMVRSDDRIWVIHPFVFRVKSEDVRLDWEHTEYKWINPEEAFHLSTVPGMDKVLMALRMDRREKV